jgi:hypothetical protein
MSPHEFFDIARLNDRSSIDSCFVEFDRRTGPVGTGSPRLAKWSPLLNQCQENYERGNYLICVPSLITVIEGAIASVESAAFKRGRLRRGFFEAKIADCRDDMLSRALWESIYKFVTHLFESSSDDFGGPRPVRLNRHWILHGRDVPDWQQPDALRLFYFLSTLDLLLLSGSHGTEA